MSQIEHILDLDNDCLAEIFKWLPFSDFEQLRHVCERFEQVVRDCCRWRYKTWRRMKNSVENNYRQFNRYSRLLKRGFDDNNLRRCWESYSYDKAIGINNPDSDDPAQYGTDLKWMVLHMRDAVQQLELPHLDYDELFFLSTYMFPNVKSLKVIFLDCNRKLNRAKVLSNVFPSLQSLLIDGKVENLGAIANMHNLIELEAYVPSLLPNMEQLMQIFTRLRLRKLKLFCATYSEFSEDVIRSMTNCKTLEEISLNKKWRPYFMLFLNEFPNLRKFTYIDCELSSHEEEKLWKDSLTFLASRVLTFYCSFSFTTISVDDMSELRELQIWHIDNSAVRYDNGTPCYFPNLRELHCWRSDTRFLHSDVVLHQHHIFNFYIPGLRDTDHVDISFWDIVARFGTLEILTVPFSWLIDRFPLAGLLEILSGQADRKKPLKLQCWLTSTEKATKVQELQYDKHLLEISVVRRPERESHWDIQCKDYLEVCLESYSPKQNHDQYNE